MEEEKVRDRKISARDGREDGEIEDPVSMVARRTAEWAQQKSALLSTPSSPNSTLKGLFIE